MQKVSTNDVKFANALITPRYSLSPDFILEADKSLTLDKGSGAVARSLAAMEETFVDPMISVGVNLGQRDVGHYDLWTIE